MGGRAGEARTEVVVGTRGGEGGAGGTIVFKGPEERGGAGGGAFEVGKEGGGTSGEGVCTVIEVLGGGRGSKLEGGGGIKVGGTESQEGGRDWSPTLRRVPGRRLEGKKSRCSMKFTWKELKMRPVAGFQRR